MCTANLCYSLFEVLICLQHLPSLPEAEFRSLVDPSNAVAQILLMHFAAILDVVYPIKGLERSYRNMGYPNRASVFKMPVLCDQIPASLHSI
jgi:hypothetical protein